MKKKLSMYVPEGVHRSMKKEADKRNITITRWVLRLIVKELLCDEKKNRFSLF